MLSEIGKVDVHIFFFNGRVRFRGYIYVQPVVASFIAYALYRFLGGIYGNNKIAGAVYGICNFDFISKVLIQEAEALGRCVFAKKRDFFPVFNEDFCQRKRRGVGVLQFLMACDY